MPGKKKKYNARFPPARIKKIMQSDDEVGKVAAPVPVIISRALEMFAETLLQRARKVTSQRGARTLTPSHLKFCIQSETRFDFLKDLVSSVPELQGDREDLEGGLGVAGERLSDQRMSGPTKARGVGRATVPGTGKRRGRPPKVLGAPPSARTKRSVEKFMDDEYDCNDITEVDSDQCHPVKSPQLPQERLLLPQPESSHRLNSFSSPFNIQRSSSQDDFSGTGIVPSRSTTSLASSSSCLPSLSFQLEINKDKTDSQESDGGGGGGEASQYQRTNSLPPPAPVYTGSYSRLFRSASSIASSNSPVQKSNWSVNPLPLPAEASNGAGAGAAQTFKHQTNGNFSASAPLRPGLHHGLHHSSPSQSNPSGAGQELDEDYDC